MKQRIVTGILFALGVAVLIGAGYWQPAISFVFLLFVCIMSVYELTGALRHRGLAVSRTAVMTGSLAFVLPLAVSGLTSPSRTQDSTWLSASSGLALMCFVLISIMSLNMILPLLRNGPQGIAPAAAGSLAMAYIAFPLGCSVILLYSMPLGWFWLVLALLTPWASDVFAYFTGSAIGRHRVVPEISPKKTIEGCLGGMVGSMLAMVLFFQLILARLSPSLSADALHIGFALVSGLLLSTASQLGDWLASAIKRWSGIKDFGRLLPGHGGILDRFDSAFFTMPVTLLLAVLYWQIFKI